MSFISYVHGEIIKPSFCIDARTSSWPRAAMFVRRDLVSYYVPQYSSRDVCCIQTTVNLRPTYVVSGYMDGDVMEIPKTLVNLLENLGKKGLILALDSNSHSVLWGSPSTCPRGEMVEAMLAKYNLTLLNKGDAKTFIGSQGSTIIDITVCDSLTSNYINDWKVDKTENFSDHRRIAFNVKAIKDKIFKTPVG